MGPLQAGSPGTFRNRPSCSACLPMITNCSVLPVIVPQYNDPELLKVRVKEADAAGVITKALDSRYLRQPTPSVCSPNLERINKALSRTLV